MENKKIDLVCYLSNGYPSHKETLENAQAYIDGGCDVIEIDIPTDNPYIDGPLLQERMIASYNQDQTLKSHLNTIRELRKKFPKQRIIILAYEETIIKLGVIEFINLYKENSAEALILVASKNDNVKIELMNNGIKVVSYVQKHLPSKEVENAKNSNGFIYLQAKSDHKDGQASLKEVVSNLKNKLNSDREIYCGVGVSTPEDIAMVKESGASGAFVGSAVFTKEADKKIMTDFISQLSKSK